MRRTLIRTIGAAFAVAAVVVFGAGPASATIDPPNSIGCAGSATITADDGTVTQVDAADAEVTVPRSGNAAWNGSIATVTHNHSGEVSLAVGPANFALGSWGVSPNDDDENARKGVKEIPSTLGGVPPGRYVVSGFHQGDEGRCSGSIIVEVGGNPLTTPAGAGAAVGTLVTGGLLAMAGREKGGVA
ncbi:MAG: hypothetical protein ACR2H3_15380 [Acidimicrobiales bacterium]